MTSLADVTAALRRADWAQLSLSAEVICQYSRGEPFVSSCGRAAGWS
jgi:hypothetical protein